MAAITVYQTQRPCVKNKLTNALENFVSHLSRLTKKHGYCFATNAYFMEQYGVTERSVTRWISTLERLNRIRTERVGNERHIYVCRMSTVNLPSSTIKETSTKRQPTPPAPPVQEAEAVVVPPLQKTPDSANSPAAIAENDNKANAGPDAGGILCTERGEERHDTGRESKTQQGNGIADGRRRGKVQRSNGYFEETPRRQAGEGTLRYTANGDLLPKNNQSTQSEIAAIGATSPGDSAKPLQASLIREGVSPTLAIRFAQEYDAWRIKQAIAYLKQAQARGVNIYSPGGFLHDYLTKNWVGKLCDRTPEAIERRHGTVRIREAVPVAVMPGEKPDMTYLRGRLGGGIGV